MSTDQSTVRSTVQLALVSTKRCRTCSQEKPCDAFARDRSRRDGLMTRCRECNRKHVKAWQRAHPDRMGAKAQRWRAANREQVLERERERRAADPEYSAKQRAWVLANPEKRTAIMASYRERNLERERARARAYYYSLPIEVRRARRNAWKQANPARVAAHNHARHAARYDKAGIDYICALLVDPCSYCAARDATIDHITPLSTGGTNHWENLTAACKSCNSSKGARPLLAHLLATA